MLIPPSHILNEDETPKASWQAIVTYALHFIPKSIRCLKGYNRKFLLADTVAGLTVGIVALPLAMAFAIASGLPPQSGIYCGVVAGFVISAFGGSRVQIGGPTGAFVVVIAGIVQKYGVDGLFMCTMMAGVLLTLLGLFRLGKTVKYIPRPVVIGFTNGIAVIIASTQIKDYFGLQIDSVPGEFLPRLATLSANWDSLSPATTFIASASLALMLLMRRCCPKVPGTLAALILGTVFVWAFQLPLETIASRFGGIPEGMPNIVIPSFRSDLILPLLSPALTVAMLGAIESLLSAVVADRMSGDKHDPNMELVAQGFANILSPLVGGLPATGAIARTATNVRSGARTPIAGIVHALTLLFVLFVAAPLAKHIPLAVLSAILLVVAYNMGEWREVSRILKLSYADISVWFITFLLTVLADLTVAVEAGMIFAALLYIRKVTETTTVARVSREYAQRGAEHSLQTNEIPDGAALYRIHGPFLFGATDKLALLRSELPSLPLVIILRVRDMTAIDATGLFEIQTLAEEVRQTGRHLLLCGMREQPLKLMQKSRFFDAMGSENVLPSLSAATARAKEILAARSQILTAPPQN